MIEIVPARALHVREVAGRMREADRLEVIAATGRGELSALAASYRQSRFRWTALVDGRPEAMFGVGDLNVLTATGIPWMLATDAVERNRREFLRLSVDWRGQLLARYDVLRNVVDCRNTVSIRWLRWLGFRFSDPFKIRGHEFLMFEMRA